MIFVSYLIPILLTVLFTGLFVIDMRKARRQREYMNSLQQQIDKLRAEHEMHMAHSTRLAESLKTTQQTYLGLTGTSQVFQSNLR